MVAGLLARDGSTITAFVRTDDVGARDADRQPLRVPAGEGIVGRATEPATSASVTA